MNIALLRLAGTLCALSCVCAAQSGDPISQRKREVSEPIKDVQNVLNVTNYYCYIATKYVGGESPFPNAPMQVLRIFTKQKFPNGIGYSIDHINVYFSSSAGNLPQAAFMRNNAGAELPQFRIDATLNIQQLPGLLRMVDQSIRGEAKLIATFVRKTDDNRGSLAFDFNPIVTRRRR